MNASPTDLGQSEPSAEAAAPRRGRRKPWALPLVLMSSVLTTLAVMALLAVLILPGREFAAPDWLRTKIEARLDTVLPKHRVTFGNIVLLMEKGWRPQVLLRDVEFSERGGRHLMTLTQTEATLAMRPLLRGQVKPRTITLSGAFLTLRRLSGGGFDLRLAGAQRSTEAATDLPAIMAMMDRALTSEGLNALRSASLRALTIRYEDTRSGRGWTVDGGRVRLTRQGDLIEVGGDFALLSGRDYAATLEMNFDSLIGSSGARFGVSFDDMAASDIAAQSPALAWLGVLRAPISGALRTEMDTTGQLGPLSGTLQIGKGAVQPTEQTRPIPFESARAYLTYDPQSSQLQFDELSVQSDWLSARAEGTASLVGMNQGWPTDLLGQFHVQDIRVNPDKQYDAPILLARSDVDFRLSLDPFQLSLGQVTVGDDQAPLHMDGTLRADREGWDVTLNANLQTIGPEQVMLFWPPQLKEKTRTWIHDNIQTAKIQDAHVALRAKQGQPRQFHLGFNFSEATVKYMKNLPPVQNGAGHVTITDNRLVVVAEQGTVTPPQGGRMDVAGTVFEISDMSIKGPPAQVDLNTESTVTAVLSLLDQKPFQFLTKAKRDVTLADGRARATARLNLRLKNKLQADEVTFAVQATGTNLRSTTLVPTKTLAIPSADIVANNEGLTISGKGRLGKVGFDGAWSMPIGKKGPVPSKVLAQVELSPDVVEEFNIGLPPGAVSGAGKGQLTLDIIPGAAPKFNLSSNLAGLGLRLDPLAWRIDAGTRGKLEVAGELSTPAKIDRIALNAPGLQAEGEVSLAKNGTLKTATFKSVRAGDWLNSNITLTGRGKGRAPAIAVTGGSIDMRNLPQNDTATQNGGSPLKVAVDRLQVTKGIALTNLKGDFDTAKGLRGNFTGRINGKAPVKGRIEPQGGRSAFEITSDDAGAVLQSADLFKKVYGGALTLTMRPKGGEGHYAGALRVRETRLRNAPAMAELLSAISIVGLLDQMGGQGILFSEVEADFRLTPTQVIVTKSSAVGPSMGLSLDGYYTLGSGAMDMQGVLSPIYLLNGIGSVLTRKGEGLFGFNFQLKGTANNPRVQVNPLSALTPGMFRELFRRPPPKPSQ